MRKNILLIVLVAAIFVFVGAMNNTAKAADDPVEAIRNAKTPVYLHSLAGGDSLVHDLPSMVDTWWQSIYPHNIFDHEWEVVDERDNGIPGLNPSDKLKLHHVATSNWVWVHVEDVTKTLLLIYDDIGPPPFDRDSMYIEYGGGYDNFKEGIPNTAPICTPWHEIWPRFSPWWTILSWQDMDGDGELSHCDTIDIAPLYWYHVQRVTITLKLEEDPPVEPVDTLFVEFSGGVDSDSLTRALKDPDSTWWHEIWPNFSQWRQIINWRDTGPPGDTLSKSDTIYFDDGSRWHVQKVSLDLVLASEPYPRGPMDADTLYVDFTGGLDSLLYPISNPVYTWWDEIRPYYCDTCKIQIKSWIDTDGNGKVNRCDTLDLYRTRDIRDWHVWDVAVDIEVQSIPDPTVPTMTQWGVIVLALLIVASAIFILLRKRRATVPA